MEEKKIKKKKSCFSIIIILLCVFFSGCQKNVSIHLADDIWYVTDEHSILLLCQEKTEQKEYKEVAKQLKGNYNNVCEAVNELQKLEQTVSVQNALAVGYIRLSYINKANNILKNALEEAETDEEKTCVLSNIGSVEWCNDKMVSYKYFRNANQKNITDPLQQLVIQSNLVKMKSIIKNENGEDVIKEIREMKNLLKKEKKLLGSNQMLGIYNYASLGYAVGVYEGKLNKGIRYMDKAIKLNKNTYQYPDLDGENEYNLAVIYSYYKNDYKQALEHINNSVNALAGWISDNHYSLLNSYLERGDILSNMNRSDEAMADYNRILDKCKPVSESAVLAYYYIGYEEEERGDIEKAVAAYINAYCINQKLEIKVDEDSHDKLHSLYIEGDYEDEGIEFEKWFKKKKEEYVKIKEIGNGLQEKNKAEEDIERRKND